MPEVLEVERYRRLAERVVGRVITGVTAPDPWFLKGGASPAALTAALVGRPVSEAGRRGKLLVLGIDGAVGLGLRFGMTGRLVVDGQAGVDELEYGPQQLAPAWDRFGLAFAGGGSLTMNDPRRLGGVELDPDVDALGPDALSVTRRQLRMALAGSSAPLKARLLDQARIAGLGNLLTDEVLWRCGLDPARRAGSLSDVEIGRLHQGIRRTLPVLLARGGSHLGDLQEARERGGRCPRDGAVLDRRTIGGRTTYSCPIHQR